MNNNIRTTIYSPISDLQFKAGFDTLLNQGTEKQLAIKRAGAVIFADGRKIDKDFNSQQTMSIQQFVPNNGYMPVFSVSRGLNVVEESLKSSRPDLTPFQIRNRPKFQLDPALDSYVDQVFDFAIAPKLSLLDDEKILQQQFRQSVGLFSQKLRQLPLTDIQTDKAAKVARMIEQDASVFRGVPVSASTNVPDEQTLLDQIDAPRPSDNAIGENTDIAILNRMNFFMQSSAYKNKTFEELSEKIESEELINGGVSAALKRLNDMYKYESRPEYDTQEKYASYGLIENNLAFNKEAHKKYEDYLQSSEYKQARLKARQREEKMRETGIPYYQTALGPDINRAIQLMSGGQLFPDGQNILHLSPLNTQLSRGVRVADRVHDAFKFVHDHLTDGEWSHLTHQLRLKQQWKQSIAKFEKDDESFAVPKVEGAFDVLDVAHDAQAGRNNRKRPVNRRLDELLDKKVPVWMEPAEGAKPVERGSRIPTGGFRTGFNMMGLITGAMLLGNAFAGRGMLQNGTNSQASIANIGRAFSTIFNSAPTTLNTGRMDIRQNRFNDAPLGYAQSALMNNQAAALQNAPAGFANAVQGRGVNWYQHFAEDQDAEELKEEVKQQPIANIPNPNPQPGARADGALDVPNVVLEQEALQNVNEEIPLGNGAVDDGQMQLQDPVQPYIAGDQEVNIPAAATNVLQQGDPLFKALASTQGGKVALMDDRSAVRAWHTNNALAEKLKQEAVLQEKSSLSWPIRALMGNTYKGEISDRFGRFMSVKSMQDKQRLATITMTAADGRPLTADAIPTQQQLAHQINEVFDNMEMINKVRTDIKQVGKRIFDIKTQQNMLRVREQQARANLPPGQTTSGELQSITQQQAAAQQQLEAVQTNYMNGPHKLNKALIKAANVDLNDGLSPDDIQSHVNLGSTMEWLFDSGQQGDKLGEMYRMIKNMAMAAVLVMGLPVIWGSISGVKMVVGALSTRVLPSITGAASLRSIADQAQLPLEQVYAAYNSVMNKVSASGFKGIPNEQELMMYLGDTLTRAKAIYEERASGYVQSAQQMMQQGLTTGMQFARQYLQPVAEKNIAKEIVSIEAEKDTSQRKTLNILGKRYKKRAGQAARMLDVPKLGKRKRQQM